MRLFPKTYSPGKGKSNAPSMPQHPQSSRPVAANFPSQNLTIGCGVAIFHLASERVVLCYHSRDEYWFLPKGRKDAGEDAMRAAEREGFEESGYRNRLLPLPIRHRQPPPHLVDASEISLFSTEPVWTQMIPHSVTKQYLLFWYVAETLPPDVAAELDNIPAPEGAPIPAHTRPYVPPPSFPTNLTLKARIAMEPQGWAPVRHENTGVDEEEALYLSFLVPVAEAREKLRGTIMADVVRKGWEAVQERMRMEAA